MPVKIRKGKGGYTVSTPKGVKGRNMTKTDAQSQKRLLNAVEHGWKPTGDPARTSKVGTLKKRIMAPVD